VGTFSAARSKRESLAEDGDSDVRTLTLSLKVHPVTGILKASKAIEIRWKTSPKSAKDEAMADLTGIG
jgi:hypothetical protein